MQQKQGVVRAVVAIALLAAPGAASADDNDLVLARLGTIIEDGAGDPIDVLGSNLDFRSVVSELGVVLAPRLLAPSDSLGFGGFQFAVDLGYTAISNHASYWRVLESSPEPAGEAAAVHGNGLMPTIGFFMRKGMWLPLPSFEIGVGAVHLMRSHLWSGQGYAKFALHEGYHDLPIPSVALRGAASRLMGNRELDLTVASFDASMSKAFGIGGTTGVSPYLGWNLLVMIARSEVIDKTPDIDLLTDSTDAAMNFVFKDQDNIVRHRLFAGLKLQYYVFALTLEASLSLAGSSIDDRGGTDLSCADATTPTTQCDAEDRARLQEAYTMSLAMDF
jgi:hypothetical protein